LFAPPERRTSAAGRDWLRFKLRWANGGQSIFVSVADFDPALIDRLAGLAPGDSVTVARPIELNANSDRDGQPAASLSVIANAVLTVKDGARRREARVARQESEHWHG